MANIRLATEEDKEGWNKVAYESSEATYAHTWEWKEVIEEGLGLESICLVAEDKGEIIGIFPAFLRPFQLDKYSYMPEFLVRKVKVLWSPLDLTWDYGGPCILPGEDKNVLEKLVVEMEKIAKKAGAISLRLSTFRDDMLEPILSQKGYKRSPRQTFLMDLTVNEDNLWKNVAKRARKYVKAAERNGVKVEEASDEKDIETIYSCITHTHNRVGAYLPPYDFFLRIHEKLGEKRISRFRIAVIEDKVIGGDVLFCFNDMVVERYRGIYEEYRDLRTNYLMVWTAIEESKKQGFSKYDLGGVSKDAEGIYFFKSRWGGELINTDWYVKDVKLQKLRTLKNKVGSWLK